MTQRTHTFQTEVQQLLHLMIHSLYSEREIFLRELISNASDACDKLRVSALTKAELLRSDEQLAVEVLPDAEAGTLTIRDNGIGLTEAEAIEHLGTIAKSGTKAFLGALPGDQAKQAQLIGQFGVGFYSAFMVADRVVVESRSATAGSDDGVRWESRGDGSFATERIAKPQRGTTVTLHLKDDAKDYAQRWKLRELIKRYSDYVAYPVKLPKELSDEDKKKNAVAELEQVNAGQALWTRPKDQISDEQYAAFYKAACHQWDEPATRLHVTVEGTLSFTALIFVPAEKPFDLFQRDKRGLSLYVRRVFVMDDCTDLLPDYLRFLRGVVDSDDLPLNVSREILQQQDVVPKLRKQLMKRILDHLGKLADSTDEKEREAFWKIDTAFGSLLREGLCVEHDKETLERLAKLARFHSSWTETQEGDAAKATSFADYKARMVKDQPAIYVITAASREAAKGSPHLESCRSKGFEVLYLCDPVDEWVAQHYTKHGETPIVNIAKGVDLADTAAKDAAAAQAKTHADFLTNCKTALGETVKEVRFTAGLSDSPCCLVGEEHDLTPQMEEHLRRMGQAVPPTQRALELNATHPLVQRLIALDGGKDARLADHLRLLHDQALLAQGGRLADAGAFAKRVQELLLNALPAAQAKAQGKR